MYGVFSRESAGTPDTVRDNHLPPRYRNPERIARGGMGEIYRAEDADLARIVAIKVLADRFADDDAIRARFTREALAAARLSNAPSTVTIFDVGEHDGHPYIVMEYLAGGSLADRLASDGAQPLGRSLEWLRQAAAALDAAHASGVVHRDVKPANLLLDDGDRVKVADFGVASAVGLGSLTEAGTVVGTAGYLAPEQARGEKATPASDRYALAVVAFELLTGARPFERESATAEAMAHVSAPIPPASSLNPELPLQVDDALARGLAKEPEHRYDSAADLVHALRDALDDAAGGTTVGALAPVAQTVKETVTLAGTTVVETVTTEPEPTTAPETTISSDSPSELNDQGFELLRAGDYEAALPLLEQAVAGLAGSGDIAEAYASYNLAFTRLALGRCDGVVELLDRSEEIQGRGKETSGLRREARKSCDGERDGEG